MVIFTILLDIVASFADFCFVKRWNVVIGIGDITWLLFGSQVLMNIKMVMQFLVAFVLVAKITPAHVEATVFSFSASIINMSVGFGTITGNIWNACFFQIDTGNLDNLYKLIILQICLGFVTLLYV